MLSTLLTRHPQTRPTPESLPSHAFFSSLPISTLNFLDRSNFAAKTREEKVSFMKGLGNVLDRFSEGLRIRKILPSLLEEVRIAPSPSRTLSLSLSLSSESESITRDVYLGSDVGQTTDERPHPPSLPPPPPPPNLPPPPTSPLRHPRPPIPQTSLLPQRPTTMHAHPSLAPADVAGEDGEEGV